MSALNIPPNGYVTPSIPAFEPNTPVLSGVTLSEVELGDALPPDGTLEYTLINYPLGGDKPIADLLINIMPVYTVTCPAGQTDISKIEYTIAGNIDRAVDLNRDIVSTSINTISSSGTIRKNIFGLLKLGSNEKTYLRIRRIGGNAAVTFDLTQVYRKFKNLD